MHRSDLLCDVIDFLPSDLTRPSVLSVDVMESFLSTHATECFAMACDGVFLLLLLLLFFVI